MFSFHWVIYRRDECAAEASGGYRACQERAINAGGNALVCHATMLHQLEEREFRRGWRAVAASGHRETIHDFYGIPEALFDVHCPAPGEAALVTVPPSNCRAAATAWLVRGGSIGPGG